MRNGLLLGASVVGAASLGLPRVAKAAIQNPQPNWWWCMYCDGLFWSGNGKVSNGVCLAPYAGTYNGGKHSPSDSDNYSVLNGDSSMSNLQDNWFWCSACQLLFWAGNPSALANSACPANSGTYNNGQIQVGPHTQGAVNYALLYGVQDIWPASQTQNRWRWCPLCEGIFWGPGQANNSFCVGQLRSNPEGGLHEFGPDPRNYDMIITP